MENTTVSFMVWMAGMTYNDLAKNNHLDNNMRYSTSNHSRQETYYS